jgi:predicted MFS family arabinose efflux permease
LTWYTNNISRKRGLLICLAFCVIGSFIMVLAHSLLVAMMGIFFIGMGYYAGPRFGTALLSEVTERLLG